MNIATWQSSRRRTHQASDIAKLWIKFLSNSHQTDNLAKLWKDYLFLLELIAKIGCAVVVARTNAVYGNKCVCCHHRDAV